jgi:hypothetical protein
MKPWRALLLGLAAVLATAAASAEERPRVFVIGDSISMHYGPFLERALAPRFAYDRMRAARAEGAANLDVPQGANGGDSRRVLDYLRRRRAKDPLAPGLLLLNCGLHDIKREAKTNAIQVPLPEYTANLRAILAEAAAMGQQVVWVRTTPVVDAVHNRKPGRFLRFAADVAAYNEAAEAVMRTASVPIIDLHAFSLAFVPEGFIDHVHYAEPIREKQAVFLAQTLNAIADRAFAAAKPASLP